MAIAGAAAGALAIAGCGLGPGRSIGEVSLTVTRDYGSRLLLRAREAKAPESETAMRLLDRKADISTRYGGRFVESIDGLGGTASGGRPRDWFFYVNGVESPVGAAEYGLHGGDRVWWDYRDWSDAMRVPAVVGSFPEPLLHGYEGKRRAVRVRCMDGGPACALAGRRLRAAGVSRAGAGGPIRVLVGPWDRVRRDPAAALLGQGPGASGVFAEFVRAAGAWRLQPLGADGSPGGPAREAGLVAATREGAVPPTWLVTGSTRADALAAARLLDARDLHDRYAVASGRAGTMALPVP